MAAYAEEGTRSKKTTPDRWDRLYPPHIAALPPSPSLELHCSCRYGRWRKRPFIQRYLEGRVRRYACCIQSMSNRVCAAPGAFVCLFRVWNAAAPPSTSACTRIFDFCTSTLDVCLHKHTRLSAQAQAQAQAPLDAGRQKRIPFWWTGEALSRLSLLVRKGAAMAFCCLLQVNGPVLFTPWSTVLYCTVPICLTEALSSLLLSCLPCAVVPILSRPLLPSPILFSPPLLSYPLLSRTILFYPIPSSPIPSHPIPPVPPSFPTALPSLNRLRPRGFHAWRGMDHGSRLPSVCSPPKSHHLHRPQYVFNLRIASSRSPFRPQPPPQQRSAALRCEPMTWSQHELALPCLALPCLRVVSRIAPRRIWSFGGVGEMSIIQSQRYSTYSNRVLSRPRRYRTCTVPYRLDIHGWVFTAGYFMKLHLFSASLLWHGLNVS